MSDLIKRIDIHGHCGEGCMACDLLKESRDEIERLTTRVKDHVLLQSEYIERIAELEAKNGKLITVFYAADAFMRCPTENYLELSNLAKTLREAIDIASDTPDSFDDLVASGGLPEAQALREDEDE